MNAPTRAAASLLSMVLLLTLALAGNHAAEAVTSPQQAFINKVAEPARSAQRSSGVPASVLIAQAIDASDWGDSKPATSAKNYFDTQCSSSMTAKQFGALARAQLGKPARHRGFTRRHASCKANAHTLLLTWYQTSCGPSSHRL